MQDFFVPKYAFFTKGTGRGMYELVAFDAALREAGIASQNLVPVSSVFPPNCQLISKEEGVARLKPGQVTFCVMARHDSNTAHQQIASAVSLIRLKDQSQFGYLAEHHASGQTEEIIGAEVEDIAAHFFSAKIGVPVEELDITTRMHVAAAATSSQEGEWVSVVSACVFLLSDE